MRQKKTTLLFMLKHSRAGSPGFRLLLCWRDLQTPQHHFFSQQKVFTYSLLNHYFKSINTNGKILPFVQQQTKQIFLQNTFFRKILQSN